MVNLKNIEKHICNICLYAFYFLTVVLFLYKYDHKIFLLRMGFMLVGSAFSVLWCLRKRFYRPLVYVLVVVVCWAACQVMQTSPNYALTDLVYSICYIMLAVILLRNEYSVVVSCIIYALCVLLLLLRIARGVPVYSILLNNSRNYVSVLLMTMVFTYYLYCYRNKKPYSIIPALIMFLLSIYAVGRGGILCSGFMLFFLTLYKVQRAESKVLRFVLWAIIAVLVICLVLFILLDNSTFMQKLVERYLSRFIEKGTMDDSRMVIWGRFFTHNSESFTNFLFGSDATLARFDGNLHNSILQSYAAFGLVGFLCCVFIILSSLFKGVKKRETLWLILFATLLIRANTDKIFFQGYSEIYLYYFALFWSFIRREKNKDTDLLEGIVL